MCLITDKVQIFLWFCLFEGLFLCRIIPLAASTARWISLAIGQDRPSPMVPLSHQRPTAFLAAPGENAEEQP